LSVEENKRDNGLDGVGRKLKEQKRQTKSQFQALETLIKK
jgi:hypothetical protein